MGKRNYLIEGGSCTGKTSVLHELRKRGYKVVDGDNELAYYGDLDTEEPLDITGLSLDASYKIWIWNTDKVRKLASNTKDEITFFCGGSRNFHKFIDVFDKVFVLDVDAETIKERLQNREEDDWGGNDEEKEFTLRIHRSKEAIQPEGIVIDTERPLDEVVDAILEHVED